MNGDTIVEIPEEWIGNIVLLSDGLSAHRGYLRKNKDDNGVWYSIHTVITPDLYSNVLFEAHDVGSILENRPQNILTPHVPEIILK